MLATSGLGAGSMAHNILLQKDFNISKVTIITNGTKEMGRNFRKQETENESSEKELSSEENVKEESHEETVASDESTTENH